MQFRRRKLEVYNEDTEAWAEGEYDTAGEQNFRKGGKSFYVSVFAEIRGHRDGRCEDRIILQKSLSNRKDGLVRIYLPY